MKIISLNVNGIGDTTKRRLVFKELRKYRKSIICLQETHVTHNLIKVIECQWFGEVAVCGVSSQAGGLMMLVAKDLNVHIEELYRDGTGHFTILRVTTDDRVSSL